MRNSEHQSEHGSQSVLTTRLDQFSNVGELLHCSHVRPSADKQRFESRC